MLNAYNRVASTWNMLITCSTRWDAIYLQRSSHTVNNAILFIDFFRVRKKEHTKTPDNVNVIQVEGSIWLQKTKCKQSRHERRVARKKNRKQEQKWEIWTRCSHLQWMLKLTHRTSQQWIHLLTMKMSHDVSHTDWNIIYLFYVLFRVLALLCTTVLLLLTTLSYFLNIFPISVSRTLPMCAVCGWLKSHLQKLFMFERRVHWFGYSIHWIYLFLHTIFAVIFVVMFAHFPWIFFLSFYVCANSLYCILTTIKQYITTAIY